MEKKQIPIITLAVFSIIILLTANIEKIYADVTVYYSLTQSNSNITLSNNASHFDFAGVRVFNTDSILYNKLVNKISVTITKIGSPNAVFFAGVWDTAGSKPTSTNALYLFGSISTTSIVSGTTYTFFNENANYTLQVGDAIGFICPACDSTNNVRVPYHNAGFGSGGLIDGDNTYLQLNNGFWNDSGQANGQDATLIISYDDGAGNPTGGIDCSLPSNANILICRLQVTNQTPLAGASQLVNASSTDLGCQIGLIACTNGVPNDTDIKTNGMGYILLMVALGIWVGLLWVASRGAITEIPNFVWMIGTIAIVGAVTVVGWIDPTILIVSIITVIALSGIKAKNIFSGAGGLFKGEEA